MIDLDAIQVERREIKDADIEATLLKLYHYRDWCGLARYVAEWGISFEFHYAYRLSGDRVPVKCAGGLPLINRVIIMDMRERPYYNKVTLPRKELRKVFRQEAQRCSRES